MNSALPRQSAPIRFGLGVKLLAAAVAIALGFGLCEIGARFLFPPPPEPLREPQLLYQSRPEMGFLHVPDQAGYLDDGFARINGLGLRGTMPESPKPPGSVRIMAIGDSTTFGWGVEDEDAYCAQLEAMLRHAFPDRRPSVINGGVGAYDLKNASRLLRHFAPTLQPDIVLIGVFWNDLPYQSMTPEGVPQGEQPASPAPAAASAPAAAAPTGTGAENRPAPFRIGSSPSKLNQIFRRSRLLYVLRQSYLSMVAPTDAASNQVRWEMALLEGRDTPAIDGAWQDLAGTLREIRDFGASSGFAAGVVVMPIRAQVESAYPQAKYQTRVRAIAESLGLFVVDPLPGFRAHPRPADLFIPYDRMHFTGAGNRIIAEAAADALRSRPEFRRN